MRGHLLLLLLLLSGGALGQAPAWNEERAFSSGAWAAEKPSWERLLFGPAPEGYRGLALSTRLLAWSVPWTLTGAVMGLASQDPWTRGFWLTSAAWTSVNSGVALAGLLAPEPSKAQLRELLYLNAGLDLLYIAGGLWLASQPDPTRQGAGWAVVVQGAWLLLFDLFNALALEGP
ncbi:hypothetical protein [Meiothermus sp. QL-1]|uniref:DUF6992 family protein n=1 Tax=Meiothermus sp. QL-1 TaxID=2058095 RepID=UPI0018F215B8|nr:hypothetical protein [Meiothermus sp. QL-1]